MPSQETMDFRIPFPEWLPEHDLTNDILRIHCPERTLYVLSGEWVLKQGTRIWTCSPEIFEEMYEPLGD